MPAALRPGIEGIEKGRLCARRIAKTALTTRSAVLEREPAGFGTMGIEKTGCVPVE